MQNLQSNIRNSIQWLRTRLGRGNENAPFYILIITMLVIFVVGMNIFLEIAEALQAKELYSFDRRIQQWVIGFRDPQLTPVVAFITDLGDRWAYLVVIGAIGIGLLIKREWWLVGQVLFVSILSALATIVLKNEYQRQRPPIEHLVEVHSLSFPSGHSLSAMAFYGFLIYLIFRYLKSKALKAFLSLICVLLILAIGLSRIYLGVHYPSDVGAGFVAGIIWASFCIVLFNVIDLWRRRKGGGKLRSQA